MATSQLWSDYYRAWSRMTPPLRPNHEVISAVKALVEDVSSRALILGVTPEFADMTSDIIALDRNYSMVRHIWPGNTRTRRAIVGNWLNQNFLADCFSLCLADGSLNLLELPGEVDQACTELARVMKRGGRFICRVLLAPDRSESISDLRAAVASGAIRNFHAFKCRLAAAMVTQPSTPNVKVHEIFELFSELFRDRGRLVEMTGWSRDEVDTIDFYQGSKTIMNFPTRRHVASVVSQSLSNVRFLEIGTYELAEHCPLLIAERH
jgi:SAM-dependent methyltransferase